MHDRIRDFILKNFYVADPNELTNDMSLLEAGLIDSTGVLEVLGFVEREFGITAADEEIVPENFDGITRIASYVERKVRSAAQIAG
jgi:acyl carrier protein